MIRRLNEWKRKTPSCHRFAFLRRSWVYKQRNSRTGAVFWVDGMKRADALGVTAVIVTSLSHDRFAWLRLGCLTLTMTADWSKKT